MTDRLLFKADHEIISEYSFSTALRDVNANECEILYVHTGMTFGLPLLDRRTLLESLYKTIMDLGVKTVIFPSFTFSFCNNRDFFVEKSSSKMGALNEFVRKNKLGVRSSDPLLSVVICGESYGIETQLSHYSLGKGSTYDILHNCGKKINFLFLGAVMWECFTYTHYIESMHNSPYRYNRKFTGNIIKSDNQIIPFESYLFTTYGNVKLKTEPLIYKEMCSKGIILERKLGNSVVQCFSEKDAYATITGLLNNNPYYLIDGSFKLEETNKTYNLNNKEVISVL